MIAKIKSANFIDTLQFELQAQSHNCIKAVLRDETGSVCSQFETIFLED
ncbi:MAG: hypothetical protein J7497_06545 [Chitinophagaceae bacterium]|nr:hypothetical protein [Chitinophagaceae bacterium]